MARKSPDLSQSAINLAVLTRSLQHPAVVYPAALGLIGAAGGALLVGSPLVFGAAALAGGVAALGFGVNYLLRRDRIASEYLAWANETILAERELMLRDLEDDLKQSGVKTGVRQLERFQEKIAAFEEVLGDKLGPHELTHARFLGVAEQVCLSGIDNLRGIALAARGLAAIDTDYIRSRIAALEKGGAVARGGAEKEIAGLKEQLQVQAGHAARIEELLGQNEHALARLDVALAAVAAMRTEPDRAAVGMETAIEELARIAQRAREYR
jgi:hypothetical protein